MWLFILILLCPVTMVTAVTGCHSDRDKDHRPRQNCTMAGFSSIPSGIELTTKVLLFPRNLFTSLSWSSFQIFQEIYEIDLTGNKVPEVTPSVSPILPTLSVLRLGWNRLTSLPDDSFSACPALTELYLDNNNIESLSNHTFSGLGKLEILELSSNRIKVLPKLLLHPLPAIETLFLEFNKIKVMPDDWFSKKEEVPYLYLSANPWACSCSLGYFHEYLADHELSVYVRDGPVIKSDAESVVCDSPLWLKDQPLVTLEETDLCSKDLEEYDDGKLTPPPATTVAVMPPTTTVATTTPITTVATTTPTTTVAMTTPTTTVAMTTPTRTAVITVAPSVVTFHTEYHRVVTWSWYETFTEFFEWSGHSEHEHRIVGSNIFDAHTSHLTERSTNTKPPTTTLVPSTAPPKLWVLTTPRTTKSTTVWMPSWGINETAGGQQRGEVRAAALFCFWLFAACALLCAASAACILATVVRLVFWYRSVYKPLSIALARRRRGGEGVRLLAYKSGEEMEAAGGGGGVMALYRSVLFIHRGEGEPTEGGDGVGEGEGRGGKERQLVTLEPTVTEEVRREERGVYKKTLYRLVSKEEAITGWRDAMEEQSWVSAGDGGRRRGGGEGGGASRKRYSVILREERGEAEGGREEMEWVVGGWEVKGGREGEGGREEEQRSSWGEWLTHYLPSMPWGVTTPPEAEVAQ